MALFGDLIEWTERRGKTLELVDSPPTKWSDLR
jgi:hypothetical protein